MPPKLDPVPDRYDLTNEIALFRYGLIAALVHDPPAKGQLELALREIAAKPYHIPGSKRTRVSVTTLRRYLHTYRTQSFEALRPPARVDTGVPRAFSSDVLAKAIALREAQPSRTTQTLVDILSRDESLTLANPQCSHAHDPSPAVRQDPPTPGAKPHGFPAL